LSSGSSDGSPKVIKNCRCGRTQRNPVTDGSQNRNRNKTGVGMKLGLSYERENRELRRIFGPKRDEVAGGWRKLLNDEFRKL
jgi:hypothetical protein